ncbi:MAG: hypothetical protein H6Q89_4287 [Myxococcaceae bacterium]|nr:hypothetical protein [Myxococcaceae bacterium]
MPALLFILLAATPVDVIVVNGPEPRAALEQGLPGSKLIDATALNGYLLHPASLLGMQDFSTFTAPPIAGWPPALDEVWKKNVAFCGKIAGPPPYRETMLATHACAQRLSKLLWQKFLEDAAPRRVYELSARVDEKKGKASVSGTTYEVRGAQALSLSEETTPKEVGAAITRVARALIAQKGTTAPREVVAELATVPTGDPLAHEPVVTTPVELKKSCDALPKELDVSPRTILGKSLAARWVASVKGTVAPQACNLQISQRDEEMMAGRVTVLTAALDCGGKMASAEASTKVAKGTTTEVLSGRLIAMLVGRFCK